MGLLIRSREVDLNRYLGRKPSLIREAALSWPSHAAWMKSRAACRVRILTRAMRRGSGFDEMDNVSSLGVLKPTPIGSAAAFLDLVISCRNTASPIAAKVSTFFVDPTIHAATQLPMTESTNASVLQSD